MLCISIHNFLVIISSDFPKVTLGEYCPLRSQKKVISYLFIQGRVSKELGFVFIYVMSRNRSNPERSANGHSFDPKDNRSQLFKSTSGE